jgi:uncharacterized protein YbcI
MEYPAQGANGRTLAAISNRIVALQRQYYGRGATKARTMMDGDFVVCVMEDIYIAAERTLIDGGRFAAVLETRSAFQDAMAPQFKAVVEEATGRRVIAFTSQIHANPDLAVEFFMLGGALDKPFSNGPAQTPDG